VVRVTWTEQALDDLEAICLYIARDSPQYARLFVDLVFRQTDRLSEFPLSGRVVPEFGQPDLREMIVGKYRVIYRVLQEETEILTVHHGARLLVQGDLT
jgi:addiction module RelE/StbE family toxin